MVALSPATILFCHPQTAAPKTSSGQAAQTVSSSERVTAFPSMIYSAIHLHMYVWFINQMVTWPTLKGEDKAVSQ